VDAILLRVPICCKFLLNFFRLPVWMKIMSFFIVNEKKTRKLVKIIRSFAALAWTEFETQFQIFFYIFVCIWKWQEAETEFKTRSSFLGPSFKLSPNFLLIYSNIQPLSSSSSFSQQFLQNRHCCCCKSFQLKFFFFDRSRADPYSPLSSHQHFKFFFSIWTIIFCSKIKIH
jgi:hypothetical protein